MQRFVKTILRMGEVNTIFFFRKNILRTLEDDFAKFNLNQQ